MHRVWPALLIASLFVIGAPVAGAIGITINATPAEPRVGDTVTLSGTVTGISTIAVYLFLTGPGLDPQGVTLDNINLPTGRGLFTTAPVNMHNNTWTYAWDTSVIIGNLKPGTYTVHVVASPVERMRFNEGESSSATIIFRSPPETGAATPLDPLAVPAAAGVAAIVFAAWGGVRKAKDRKRERK